MKYICDNCGSDKVQCLMWVDLNTKEIKGSSGDESDDSWCDECHSHCTIIAKSSE